MNTKVINSLLKAEPEQKFTTIRTSHVSSVLIPDNPESHPQSQADTSRHHAEKHNLAKPSFRVTTNRLKISYRQGRRKIKIPNVIGAPDETSLPPDADSFPSCTLFAENNKLKLPSAPSVNLVEEISRPLLR